MIGCDPAWERAGADFADGHFYEQEYASGFVGLFASSPGQDECKVTRFVGRLPGDGALSSREPRLASDRGEASCATPGTCRDDVADWAILLSVGLVRCRQPS